MPLLAYCVVLDDRATKLPCEGVLGARIELVAESGLIALCSEIERSAISSGNFQQAALEFHCAVQAVFAAKAVIPFRFPTWLSTEEMRAHLRQESPRYQAFLAKHADQVQMEIRIQTEPAVPISAASGTEHLRARAAQMRKLSDQAQQIKNLAADARIEWRDRATSDGIRLFALVLRSSIQSFREKLNSVPARITGPWPATEFFESPPRKD